MQDVKTMKNTEPAATVFLTSLQWVAVLWEGDAVSRLAFGFPSPAAALQHIEAQSHVGEDAGLSDAQAQLVDRLKQYASGEGGDFADIPVSTAHMTTFQKRVTAACRAVPAGSIATYGDLAAAAGSPRAARAVGSVMSKNRVPLIIPCHRITSAGNLAGGYSAPGGLDTKRKLLQLEGVQL